MDKKLDTMKIAKIASIGMIAIGTIGKAILDFASGQKEIREEAEESEEEQ